MSKGGNGEYMKVLESKFGVESVDELAIKIAKAVKRSIIRMNMEQGWSSPTNWEVLVVVDGDVLGICVNLSDVQHPYAQRVLIEEYKNIGGE